MKNRWKILLFLVAALAALFVLAGVAFQLQRNTLGADRASDRKSSASDNPRDLASTAVPSLAQGATTTTSASSPLAPPAPLPALPRDAASVPDRYLNQLSDMVDLAHAESSSPDKNQWKRAIADAQKLMEGPCDCAQRNWLNRFVEMGNFALAGDTEQYRKYAALMATLGRNDAEAMALSKLSH